MLSTIWSTNCDIIEWTLLHLKLIFDFFSFVSCIYLFTTFIIEERNLHDQWPSYFRLHHIPLLLLVLQDWIHKSPNECNKFLKQNNHSNDFIHSILPLMLVTYHPYQDQFCSCKICFHLHQLNWGIQGFGCKFDLRKRFLHTHLQRNSSILQICKRDLHSKHKVLKVLCFGAGSHILIESFSEKFM